MKPPNRLPPLNRARDIEKTDDELNNPYAHVDLPNCIQALEVMKALHIQAIHAVSTTTTKGLITAPADSFSSSYADRNLTSVIYKLIIDPYE